MFLKNCAVGGIWAFLAVSISSLAGCGNEVADSSDSAPPPSHDDAGVTHTHPDAGPGPTSHPDSGASHHPTKPKPSDAGKPDRGPVLSHGKPSTTYPAFTPFMPPIVDNGGAVLTAPEIVTVTWSSDTSSSSWQAFDDTIGSMPYWSTATSQYGVGAPVVPDGGADGGTPNHVVLTSAAPTMWFDTDVANLVQTSASDVATSGWPAPTANTLYTIYLPPSTSATFQLGGYGTACGSGGGGFIGGYHDNVAVPGVGDVAYAVIIECPGLMTTDINESASHELVEAVTDPHPSDIPAYVGVDDTKYFAWDYFQAGSGTEIGDMCEVYYDSFYVDGKTGFGLQRVWSNSSAIAGHAPCVPAASGSYFNVTPLDLESITIDGTFLGGTSASAAMGYYVPVGGTKTFAVGFYSDGPTGGPWNIAVEDVGDPYAGYYFTPTGTSKATVSLDVTSGENGNMAYVTVTLDSVDQTKSDLIVVRSEGGSCPFGGCRHYMPILISSNGL
jgi:hypothetical protein